MKRFTTFLITTSLLLATVSAGIIPTTPAGEIDIDKIDSYVNSDPDSAIIICDEALQRRSADAAMEARLLSIRGNAFFTLGDCHKAIADFSMAASLAEKAADPLLCVNALSDLGVAYRVNQQPDSALIYYNKALSMAQGKEMPDMEANILTSIAVLFANQGRFAEAVTFAEKGVEKSRQTDDIETQIYASSSLGSALFLAGEQERGLSVQRSIVNVAERKGVPRYILKTYASIIAMHNRLGNQDSVRHYISRGEILLQKVPEASIESIGFMEQSFVLLTAMGRYRESLDIQSKILDMQDSRPFMPLDRLWQRIALNYKGLGDIEKMDQAYSKAIAIADSIHQSDIDSQISELTIRYETAEKELEIANLKAEKSRRDKFITIFVALIAITLLILGFYLRGRRRKIELDNISARLDGIEQERSRLAHELHDGVCNDLLGIELTLEASGSTDNELAELIRTTRNEVRSISHELLPPRFNGLSLSQLLADYALKSDGFVTFHAIGNNVTLNPQSSINLYRIVQEWVANLRHHNSATEVSVTLAQENGTTTIEITDNGEPFDPSASPHRGLGLENIHRRIKLLQATFVTVVKDNHNVMSVKIFE